MTRLEKKLIIIGITVVITIVLTIMGYSFLKGNNPLKKDRYFYVVYPDIQGLSETAPVFLSGKTIGQVKQVDFLRPDTNALLVTLIIEENVKIPAHSIAKIITTDVLGTRAIRIIPDYHTHQWAQPGDTLIAGIEKPMQEVVMEKIAPLEQTVDKLNQLLTSLNTTLDTQAINQIHQSLSHLRHSLMVLDTTISGHQVQSTLTSLEKFSQNLAAQQDTINSILSQTNQIVSQVNKANLKHTITQIDSMVTSINTILEQIQAGNGSLGRLYSDEELYHKLDSITTKINQLLDDILANPKHYIKVSVF